jgi:hypothetical protein
MARAFRVIPAEPVSNARGILTVCVPTAVTITNKRAGLLEVVSTAYRSNCVGLDIVVIAGAGAEEGADDGADDGAEEGAEDGADDCVVTVECLEPHPAMLATTPASMSKPTRRYSI